MTGWLRKHVFGVDKAQESAAEATNLAVAGQQDALNYLKETEALPMEIRDKALSALGEYYKAPGPQLTQEQLIQQAMQSPLYASIMGGRKAGEEGIARYASATGGLRSGGFQHNLYDYNTQLSNDALLKSYDEAQQRQDAERLLNLQGLSGLAGIGTNEGAIANLMAGIGETRSQGALAKGQIRSQGTQNALDLILGTAQAATTAFSDIRLKRDIRYLGSHNGLNFYGWTWNELAKTLGLEGECSGVLAHEVHELYPEATSVKDGFVQVDYSRLPMEGIH